MTSAKTFRLGAATVAFLGLFGLAQSASAGSHGAGAAPASTWAEEHPRRDEVNDRVENQDKRIDAEEKSGKIDAAQATTLHQQDQAIRSEEKTMASHDAGHITKADQKSLNQQLNSVSKEIKADQ